MITQDEAIALAKEVGAEEDWGSVFQMNRKDLTALCNAVRKQTLLEAAEACRNVSQNRKDSEASARSGAFECSIAILNISEGK